MTTVALIVLVIGVGAIAVIVGRMVARSAAGYVRWARATNREHRSPAPLGMCANCRHKPARGGSEFCSDDCATDADYKAAGY